MKNKYERKQIRRQIRIAFFDMVQQSDNPSPKELYGFLVSFKDNLDEMRQILDTEKNSNSPWATELWRLLKLNNVELFSEINQLVNEKLFLIEATKMQLRTRCNNSINLDITTSVNGPNYEKNNPDLIKTILLTKLEEPIANFELDTSKALNFPGTYPIKVLFDDQSFHLLDLTINISDTPKLPSELSKYLSERQIRSNTEVSTNEEIEKIISETIANAEEKSTEYIDEITQAYLVANKYGFSKTAEANRLLRKWYSLYTEKNKELEFNSSAQKIHSQFDATQMMEGLSIEETEKLKVLNLPPLVLNDLMNATVDENAIRLVINSYTIYNSLRKKSLDNLTIEEIRSLSPRGKRWKIADLKLGRIYADPRTIAKVLITIARLFFERLRIGTAESDIRYCLSYYCTRFGEYLTEQHGRYDLAREFFIEAITLNRSSGSNTIDFPAGLLFRSFQKTKNLPLPGKMSSLPYFIKLIEQNPTNDEEILKTAIRSILELGNQQQDLALRWFLYYEDETKAKLLALARTQLKIGRFADLSECIEEYRKHQNELHALLTHLYNANSIQAIVQNKNIFREKTDDLGFLINQTNIEILGILQQVMYSLENYLQANQYTSQKSNLETAKNQLEKILNFGADNYTSLWAQHLRPISGNWTSIINKELITMSKGNFAFIEVSLAEEHISYYEKPDLTRGTRVIYRIKNTGNAPAKRVNIYFTDDNGESFATQKSNFDLDANEVAEDYFSINHEAQNELLLNYSGTFYDMDGKKTEFKDNDATVVKPIQQNESLQKLINPFQADREVDDEKMFVGRSSLLEEVSTYAISQPSGSLLMLHGQRRVGKSSLLFFIEKNIDLAGNDRKILGVKISWINYTQHKAHHLWMAIAKEIQYKLKKQFNAEFQVPSENEFKESYTVAFNNVLDELRYSGINRLILLWDEFDGIVNLIDKKEYNYDRLFFEYLRGLSKRKNFTLILTGGELMPILFERWGEVFNHDRTWRIAYLSPTDGSVEKLIRNEYVNEAISFSDEAINLIKDSSACNPFFIQMICRDLVAGAKNNNSSHICKLDVEEIVERLVKRNLEIKYVKHLYTPRLEPDPLDLAMIGVIAEEEIENKKNKFVDRNKILAKFPNRSEDKAINKLGELVRREILDQNPSNKNEYRVKLPIFRDWFYDNNPEYELWVSELKR